MLGDVLEHLCETTWDRRLVGVMTSPAQHCDRVRIVVVCACIEPAINVSGETCICGLQANEEELSSVGCDGITQGADDSADGCL